MTEPADAPPTQIDLEFGDGSYLFRLGLEQIAELQTKCGCGIAEVFARVMAGRIVTGGDPDGFNLRTMGLPADGRFNLADVRETIRLALIGGGKGLVDGQSVAVDALRARQLVDAYCYPVRALREDWDTATAILGCSMVGYQNREPEQDTNDDKKKAEGLITPTPL